MIAGEWNLHLVSLIEKGRDLKYPFLRELAQDAGVSAGAPTRRLRRQLDPYRNATMRWALSQIASTAQEHGAKVMVMLLPSTAPRASGDRPEIAEMRSLLAELEVPFVDVMDTFAGRSDLATLRYIHPILNREDSHPNDAGYRLLFERLYEQIHQNPQVLQLLRGQP
jgi:lysophospholipase L1-like esterase